MIDLFGNEHPEPSNAAPAIALNMFDAAAERKAIASGRPVSQERAELVAPPPVRYIVKATGTPKRPWEVWDIKGGWVCMCSSRREYAEARAAEQNERNAKGLI